MISFSKSVPLVPAGRKKSSIESPELYFSSLAGNDRSAKQKGALKASPILLSFSQMRLLYLVNVWVRICVDKIVNRAALTPFIVRPMNLNNVTDETKKRMDIVNEWLIRPNGNGESLMTVRKKLHHDILVLDAGAIENAGNTNISVAGTDIKATKVPQLYCLPGDTVRPNPDPRGIYPNDDTAFFQYSVDQKIIAQWKANQILYHVEHPRSNQVYGVSRLETLVNTVKAELDAADHNAQFFENNATPRFAVLFADSGLGQGSANVQRFRNWWDQELRGKPHRPIVISAEKGSVQFERVSMSADEMQFEQYQQWLMMKILAVYNVPPMVAGIVGSNFSKANSEKEEQLFKQDAIKPQLQVVTNKWNTDLIFGSNGFGYNDVYLDHDLDLIDRDRQARYHEKYLRSGSITINEVRAVLGLHEVPWGHVPALQNNLQVVDDEGQPLFDTEDDDVNENDIEQNDDERVPEKNKRLDHPAIYNFYKRKILSSGGLSGTPIGWENLEPSKRVDVIEKILKNRVAALNKAYSFPKTIMERENTNGNDKE